MKTIINFALFTVIFSMLFSIAIAKEIKYDRDKARIYASQHCGTSPETGYNHTAYTCFNGDIEQCRKENPQIVNACKDKNGNTINGQPAMLMYDYGLGRVIVSSMFSDWGHAHSQATQYIFSI